MELSAAVLEAQLYHDPARHGYFALARVGSDGVYRQQCYHLAQLPCLLTTPPQGQDVWISQNEFVRPSRRIVDLLRLCLCYVDLDTYKMVAYDGLTPEQLVAELIHYCEMIGIPRPSTVVYSGGGLQAKWLLTAPIPRQALPRWIAVQTHLTAALRLFGADGQAKDAGRILRVVGTDNTRWQRTVRSVYPADDVVQRYDWEQLAYETLPIPRAELQALRAARKEHNSVRGMASAAKHNNGARRLNAAQLWWDRLEDLRSLMILRNWTEQGVPVGLRNTYLVVATNALAWCVTAANFEAEMTTLWQTFCPTLTVREAHNAACEAHKRLVRAEAGEKIIWQGKERDPRYHYRNATLIDLLSISSEEQKHLHTITGAEEKAERHRQRNRKHSNRAEYVAVQQASASQRAEQASALQTQGRSLCDIAVHMGISRNAVQGLLKRHRKKQAGE